MCPDERGRESTLSYHAKCTRAVGYVEPRALMYTAVARKETTASKVWVRALIVLTETKLVHDQRGEPPHPAKSNPPVHVAGLRTDSRLSGVDAGVVNDCRDVLVAIPNLRRKGGGVRAPLHGKIMCEGVLTILRRKGREKLHKAVASSNHFVKVHCRNVPIAITARSCNTCFGRFDVRENKKIRQNSRRKAKTTEQDTISGNFLKRMYACAL